MSEAEIAQANKKFERVFKDADTEALAALYTADGICLPPDAGVVRGRDAIRTMWAGAISELGAKALRLETIDLEVTGDTACEVGEATLELADGGQPVLKYVVAWKKEDGAWKLHRDIWNAKA